MCCVRKAREMGGGTSLVGCRKFLPGSWCCARQAGPGRWDWDVLDSIWDSQWVRSRVRIRVRVRIGAGSHTCPAVLNSFHPDAPMAAKGGHTAPAPPS